MENELAFFQACEKGDLLDAINRLRRTTLSLKEILPKLQHSDFINKIKDTDEKGETALHLAVREDCTKMVEILVKLDTSLCGIANKEGETPLKLAVSLSVREALELLIPGTPNALHCIVELNQVELVEYLIRRKVDLKELINEPYQLPTNAPGNEGNGATDPHHVQPIDGGEQHPEQKSPQNTSGDGGGKHSQSPAGNNKRAGEKNSNDTNTQDDQPIVRQGDMPLHIAARNKFEHMVNLLLGVPKVNKLVRNSEGKTPFDIAKEVTEYHESFRTIRKLGDFRGKHKPFMYCAPKVNHKKYMKARSMVNKAYEDRRNAELVVAALLAAMTCAAAFTIPGGFNSESSVKENEGIAAPNPNPNPTLHDDQGTPLLIPLVSFKLFIIFDCVAFFLALFVCIMWEMSSELTTGDKMLFMTINSLVVCCSFGFTSYGFMAAVYAMLARKVKTFSWVVLGSLIAITSCGVLAFIRQSLHFAVMRARFHRLCGVSCFVDDIVEKVWHGAERCGLLNLVRSGDDVYRELMAGQAVRSGDDVSRELMSGQAMDKSGDGRTNNSHCFPSSCCNHV